MDMDMLAERPMKDKANQRIDGGEVDGLLKYLQKNKFICVGKKGECMRV